MICKVCRHNKAVYMFGQYEPGRSRKTCNACRAAVEKRRAMESRRKEFSRVTGWPVP